MSPEDTVEIALSALVAEAHELVRTSDRPLRDFFGIALYSTELDERVRGLANFAHAAEAVPALPEAGQHYPGDGAERVVLQFVYSAIKNPLFVDSPEAAFRDTWRQFREEAAVPDWTFRGVANLEFLQVDTSDQGFQNIVGAGATGAIRLTDDVVIVGRSETILGPLGCDSRVMDRLLDEWGAGFGPSTFVLVAESRQPKTPENFVLASDGRAMLLANTVIEAMRLVAPGHVGNGQMYLLRLARFNVGVGGSHRTGVPRPSVFGSTFDLTPSLRKPIARVHAQLEKLRQPGVVSSPPGLPLALRYFFASYDRVVASDALVDLVTSLEALLGTDIEITYRLSTRVAHILTSG
ncbi:MAG: hypothetical protein M3548_01075, partial [Actinomycetota bacterium]|nr:hypothetical protein [Actinomycetota bacterium]